MRYGTEIPHGESGFEAAVVWILIVVLVLTIAALIKYRRSRRDK